VCSSDLAFVFEALFGVVFGIISGLKKGKWYDSVILIVSLLLISVPTFVTGFVMQYFIGVKWRLLPVTAGSNPGFLDLLMPAMVLGSVSMAYIIRLTRSEVSSNIAEDYVRTARAKGMSNRSVLMRHILRNSLIPVVTYLGQDLGMLMSGAMISETIFNIHGVGFLTYQSILKGESNLVVSVVTLLTLIFVVTNLIVDMLYALLDPRIRYA
jgi:oligopeptide transport system permease protein